MFDNMTYLIVAQLPAWAFVVALLLAFFANRQNQSGYAYNALQSLLFFSVGLQGLWAFTFHVFFNQIASSSIGWMSSPFEYEVGIANLAFGILGFIAFFKANKAFSLATVIGITVFLWGAAIGHIYQIIAAHNDAPNNAGMMLYMDILIPLSMIGFYYYARFPTTKA